MERLPVWVTHGQQIVEMRKAGCTLREIGDTVGVSYERVRQILNKKSSNDSASLLSENKVIKFIGCSPALFIRRRMAGLIKPSMSYGRINLYDNHQLDEIKAAIQRYCKNCGQPLPIVYRGTYCLGCRSARNNKNNKQS